MAPKYKYTKEEIIAAGVDIARKEGFNAITARGVGERLNSSSKVIFGHFSSMQELLDGVINRAEELYQERIANAIRKAAEEGDIPPYKASGMAYISFARNEKELFKLLFMRDRSEETIVENRESIRPILDIIKENLSVDDDDAYLFHMENWIYVHGIATMIATSYLDWDDKFISDTLTDIYMGLRHRFLSK